ncbi:MAG TPA: hypothetical protein VFA77_10375 [Candidatus Eisenbacteria bacterium]|nr:hypothetical protein [Candidatus Eisenbacteria bacterium]
MAKLSKEKRNQIIAVVLGTLAVGAGLWYGVIKTRRQSIEDTRKRLETMQNKLESARNYVKKADQVEADMERAVEKLKTIEGDMASGVDLYSWSYALLEKARTGEDVEIVEVTRPLRGEVGLLPQFPYDAAIFTIKGIGYYHDFGKFLADFENKYPYFYVQNPTLGSEPTPDIASGRIGKEKLLFKMDIVALIKPTR